MATSPSLPLDRFAHFSQTRFYAGETIFTEGMSGNHFYLIKDGEVDLYLVREEKKVIVETLRAGQCFGIAIEEAGGKWTQNAAARSYCELYVVPASMLQQDLAAATPLVQNLFSALLQRLSSAQELIATRVNFQPEILLYANLLQLLGRTEADKKGASSQNTPPKQAAVALAELATYARALLGHSDLHIKKVLGRMLALHLVRISDEGSSGKQIVFSAKDIVQLARRTVENNADLGKEEFQYLNVTEFASLVDFDRNTILKKLSRSEFSDDLFAFRKSEIIRLLDTKGRKFFVDRKLKTPQEFSDIEDLEFADQKSLFASLAKFDPFDLAKALSDLGESPVRERVLASLSRARRDEVEHELSTPGQYDPIEVQRIRDKVVADVKETMLNK